MKYSTTQLIYDIFAGRTANLREIKERCGLSTNEICSALECLRDRGFADSDGKWNVPITFKPKE